MRRYTCHAVGLTEDEVGLQAQARRADDLPTGVTVLGTSEKTGRPPSVIVEERPRAGVAAKGMTRQVLLLTALSLAGSAMNYASNLAFARALTPASYGDLTSLLALSVVVAVPFTAAQTRVAARVSAYSRQGRWDRVQYVVRNALAHLTVIAIGATLLYFAIIPAIVPLLHLSAIGPALALGALIFVGFLFPVLQGALQGLERWVAFGLVGIGIAAARLVFGLPWALAGGGAGGALAGQAIGMLACLASLVWVLRVHVRSTGNAAAWAGVRRRPDVRGVAAGAAFVFFAVIANCDVVLAKIFLSAHQAGEYAALATVGKIVVFLPTAVAVVVVPHATKAGNSAAGRARVLRFSALLVAGAALLAIIPAALAPNLVIRTMFGVRYLGSVSGVLPIVCAGGGLALLYLLVTFTVAIEDTRWTWLLALGVVLQVVLIGFFHGSPTQVAVAQAAVVLIVLAVNEVKFHSLLPWRRHA